MTQGKATTKNSNPLTRVERLGALMGYRRLAEMVNLLMRQRKGESVCFSDASLPKGVKALHHEISRLQRPVVQALCEELGYEIVAKFARDVVTKLDGVDTQSSLQPESNAATEQLQAMQ